MKNPGYEEKNFLVKRPLLELFTQLYFIHSYIVDKSQIPTFQSRPYLNKVPKLWGEKLGTPLLVTLLTNPKSLPFNQGLI